MLVEAFFKLKERNTTVRQEVLAGLTTFLAMAYIVIVNPAIVSETGMPFQAVLLATCFSAAFATLLMGLLANYPFALAPGMGLNAYFTYSVVLGSGISWQTALGAVFLSGVLFLVLSVTKAREAIINSVPLSLKYAIAAGIGAFLTFIGLKNGGIVVGDPATFVALGNFRDPSTLLAALGVLITVFFVVRKIRGAILLGIIATWLLAMPMGLATFPSRLFQFPSISAWTPVLGKLDIAAAISLGVGTIIFVFLFTDLFDSMGTFIGLAEKAGYLDEKGRMPNVGRALVADSVGTVTGSFFGTPTVTTYVESSAGISEGGRTGLTAIVVAAFFLVAPLFLPIIEAIPGAATAPALVVIGAMMMSSLGKIEWEDIAQAIPAFLAMLAMPFTFSIANGIFLAFIAYSFICVVTGKSLKAHLPVHILSILFVLKFIFV